MTTYFCADLHFCHERVIKFSNRPYPDISAMNEGLIRNWNARVTANDDVWVLGDFAYKNKKGEIGPIFDRLNGRKRLVIGNHDNAEVLALPWAAPPVMMADIVAQANNFALRVTLCHYPMRSWNHMYSGGLHLYGHEHGHITDYHNTCDVGVDVWNWQPITMEEACARMMSSTRNPIQIQMMALPLMPAG